MSIPTRTGRTTGATTGRLKRSATTSRRPVPAPRRATRQRRGLAGGWLPGSRPQRQSALKRMLSAATGALPGLAKRGSTSSSKSGRAGKAGGVALLAGAAGLAFKNRDKVTSLARRNATSPGTPAGAGDEDRNPAMNAGAGDAPKV
jgi:hypothetical protein